MTVVRRRNHEDARPLPPSHPALAWLAGRYGRGRPSGSSGGTGPLMMLPKKDPDQQAPEAPGISSGSRPFQGRMIMLIGPSPEVHALVEIQLTDHNTTVYPAYSCSEALQRLNDCLPDLVLVDYHLLD